LIRFVRRHRRANSCSRKGRGGRRPGPSSGLGPARPLVDNIRWPTAGAARPSAARPREASQRIGQMAKARARIWWDRVLGRIVGASKLRKQRPSSNLLSDNIAADGNEMQAARSKRRSGRWGGTRIVTAAFSQPSRAGPPITLNEPIRNREIRVA